MCGFGAVIVCPGQHQAADPEGVVAQVLPDVARPPAGVVPARHGIDPGIDGDEDFIDTRPERLTVTKRGLRWRNPRRRRRSVLRDLSRARRKRCSRPIWSASMSAGVGETGVGREQVQALDPPVDGSRSSGSDWPRRTFPAWAAPRLAIKSCVMLRCPDCRHPPGVRAARIGPCRRPGKLSWSSWRSALQVHNGDRSHGRRLLLPNKIGTIVMDLECHDDAELRARTPGIFLPGTKSPCSVEDLSLEC